MSRCMRCDKPNRNGSDVCDRCEEELREEEYRAELERGEGPERGEEKPGGAA